MHQTALDTGALFFRTYCRSKPAGKVVDIGGLNVNGSLRDVCPERFEYVGIDFAAGPGVDIILDDPYALPLPSDSVDVVVCSSCFEHSEMFWLIFLEVIRILKPDGVFYLNVPSNGLYHRYPVDCWRFYPDSGKALATWARRSGYSTELLESFISRRRDDAWNDFVAIFVKDAACSGQYTGRISDEHHHLYNLQLARSSEVGHYQEESEDQQVLADLYRVLGKRDARIEELSNALTSGDGGPLTQQRLQIVQEKNALHQESIGELQRQVEMLRGELSAASKQIEDLKQGLQFVHRSGSWRLTAPFRFAATVAQILVAGLFLLYYKAKRESYRIIGRQDKVAHYTSKVWRYKEAARRLGMAGTGGKLSAGLLHPWIWRIKAFVRSAGEWARRGYLHYKLADYKIKREYYRLRGDPQRFGRYSNKLLQYRAKVNQLRFGGAPSSSMLAATQPVVSANIEYVPRLDQPMSKGSQARLICFYLPQFHAIPENDEWWGKGFTEWTNVRPARPQFSGHYQPHVPGELGHYDLTDPEVQRRQIELARLYGIHGFCFYFYWFNGKRLLETPIENYLNDPTLDLPFCLCWANENWSRRWDGRESHILIAQQHSPQDDIAFISHIAKYIRDGRYIRVDGKPLLLVYRPELLPSAPQTARRWRDWCREHGIGEIHLAYTQSFEKVDPAQYGFDAAIEFPPNRCNLPVITPSVVPLRGDFDCNIYDWRELVARSERYQPAGYRLYRGLCPAWDNTARRKNRATVVLNSSPQLYQHWLENAIRDTESYSDDPSEQLVFINAWNEWAEGTHLEPDQRYGYAYLQATRDALGYEKSVLLITHDCHPHGAQFLSLEIARKLKAIGYKVFTIALDGGILLDEFNKISMTVNVRAITEEQLDQFLDGLRRKGVGGAITSTVVSGAIVPRLKAHGFRVLSLIHELPGVIRDMRQEHNAALIAEQADKVVFPAELVSDKFAEFATVTADKLVIRAQGVLRRNPYKGRKADAQRILCEKFRLPPDAKIALAIGYLDARKGADLFVEIAAKVVQAQPNAYFIWVGHAEKKMQETVQAMIEKLDIAERVLLTGFDRDPMAYYAGASVYILASREDPFPNVALEAAEAGTPVVAFSGATGAGDFVVKHGGRLAAAFDTDDFAEKVSELMAGGDGQRVVQVGSMQQYVLDLMYHLTGQPRVSVVVPNYNYARYLRGRLDSICYQDYPIYELIVLDDASTDQSVELCEEYLGHHLCDSRIVRNQENSGSVFRQWQKGVGLCSGDLVWIAEADDQAHKGFLKVLAPAFADPEIVLAYAQSKQMGEHDEVLAGDYLEYTQDVCPQRWTKDYVAQGRDEIARALSVKNTIPNVSGVLFRRSALLETLDRIGDQLCEYRIAGDWMVYLHLLQKGKVHFCATALNLHRRHASGVTNSTDASQHLREVNRMQELAAEMTDVPEEIRRKVRAYNIYLRKRFHLPSDAEAA